eukprot:TRINITY_DN57_c0_g1_i1.p1 TRINITY_DN57_c0_g1~~TRINITY_DN57_c0_g1_i1.p1  ORF type:complete len:384 (-),score=99.73 TRINITY_DN57_c0_g1_i1:22-1134(-)
MFAVVVFSLCIGLFIALMILMKNEKPKEHLKQTHIDDCFFSPKQCVQEKRQEYCPPPSAYCEELGYSVVLSIPTLESKYSIPLLINYPKGVDKTSEEKLPVVFFIHGGGFFEGELKNRQYLLSRISNKGNCITVQVEYRLTPEYRFPIPLLDCFSALNFITDPKIANKFHFDVDNMVIAGDSAGGNLTLGTWLMSKRITNKFNIKGITMLYPCLSLDFTERGYKSKESVTVEDMMQCYSLYLPENYAKKPSALLSGGFSSYDVSIERHARLHYNIPLFPYLFCIDESTEQVDQYEADFETCFRTIPKTFIVGCEQDCLLDDAVRLSKKLNDINAETLLLRFDVPHAFIRYKDFDEETNIVVDEIVKLLKE